jgi:eukaryotic-like serine/threonine-protein kinase
VTAQLIDPLDNAHVWAEKYSGKLEDIFEIQEQISRQIVDALKMRLSPEEDKKLAARPIDNVEAFECYQRARHEIYQFTPDGLDRALDLIETALRIVGDNELLYAAMGTIYWQYVNAAIKPDDGYIEKAEECVRRIFALNPDSAPGHSLLGSVRQNRGRSAEAVQSFKKALSIDPNNLYARMELGRVYQCAGAIEESRKAYKASLEADPLGAIIRGGYMALGLFSGDTAVVQIHSKQLLREAPRFIMLRWPAAMGHVHGRQIDEARRILREAPPERVPTIAGQCGRFLLLALDERIDEAKACFDPDLLSRARNVEFWSWWVSESYAFIDERELAIDWLENAFRRGFFPYPYVSKYSSAYRKLDNEPRFQQLLEKIKTTWEEFEP